MSSFKPRIYAGSGKNGTRRGYVTFAYRAMNDIEKLLLMKSQRDPSWKDGIPEGMRTNIAYAVTVLVSWICNPSNEVNKFYENEQEIQELVALVLEPYVGWKFLYSDADGWFGAFKANSIIERATACHQMRDEGYLYANDPRYRVGVASLVEMFSVDAELAERLQLSAIMTKAVKMRRWRAKTKASKDIYCVPTAPTAAQEKPWASMGISRAKYYRMKAAGLLPDAVPAAQCIVAYTVAEIRARYGWPAFLFIDGADVSESDLVTEAEIQQCIRDKMWNYSFQTYRDIVSKIPYDGIAPAKRAIVEFFLAGGNKEHGQRDVLLSFTPGNSWSDISARREKVVNIFSGQTFSSRAMEPTQLHATPVAHAKQEMAAGMEQVEMVKPAQAIKAPTPVQKPVIFSIPVKAPSPSLPPAAMTESTPDLTWEEEKEMRWYEEQAEQNQGWDEDQDELELQAA